MKFFLISLILKTLGTSAHNADEHIVLSNPIFKQMPFFLRTHSHTPLKSKLYIYFFPIFWINLILTAFSENHCPLSNPYIPGNHLFFYSYLLLDPKRWPQLAPWKDHWVGLQVSTIQMFLLSFWISNKVRINPD